MATKGMIESQDFLISTADEGAKVFLNNRFRDVMSLGPNATANVCKLLRHYLISTFGMEYFTKINYLVRKKIIANTDENREYVSTWMDNDVMEAIDLICEADIFDDPKSISALADIIVALYSSLESITEESINNDVDYVLDVPYQLSEMVKYSPNTPRFYQSSFKHEERDKIEKIDVHMSDKRISLSYRMDVRRWIAEK